MKKTILQQFNAHLGTVLSTSLVLFLVGLMLTVLFWSGKWSAYVKENMTVSVELVSNTKEQTIEQLRADFSELPAVKSITYVSKEQAVEEATKELGRNPVEYLGYNPLWASLEIRLKADYANPDSIKRLEKTLTSRKEVANVSYQHTIMKAANRNIARITLALALLGGVLFFIAIVLINNTVRLNIYANRFLFNTMKLVGATRGFIVRPIVREQIMNGIVAAILATVALAYVQYRFHLLFGGSVLPVTFGIAVVVLLAGIVITGVAAYVAAVNYLRLKTGELHKI